MKTGRPALGERTAFGERLYQLREHAGLTQAQVAEKLGISHRAYAFWERVPTAISVDQLAILAEMFEVSADYLIGRESPQPKGAAGPTGKLKQAFETASKLPRRQQQKILDVVDALIAQAS